MKNKRTAIPIILFGVCICGVLIIIGLIGGWFVYQHRSSVKAIFYPTPSVTASLSETTQEPPAVTQQPTLPAENGPVDPGAIETLNTLKNSVVPENDYVSLTERLKGIHNIPETIPNSPKNYNLGDMDTFWISQDDTHQNYQVKAILRYKGDHLYFWVDEQSHYDPKALELIAKTFEDKIYPTDRAFFGSEWSPGIDNDPHLYILYAHGIGNRIAGYFSARDEVPPMADPYSNGHEMFVINADQAMLNDGFTYGVLAHEFQHMIHWNRDRNDAVWINEGFSELAMLLNGYYGGGFDVGFINNPDLQLNDWPNDPQATTAHYGAAFLFLDYFLNRFGENPTQALVGEKANGLDKVDNVLEEFGIKDSETGKIITADDVFADWAVTNYLLNPKVGDGRYQYQNYPAAPKVLQTIKIKTCPDKISATVHQYGSDYIDITCKGKYTLNFQGNTETKLIPIDAHSGNYAFWSNKGDYSDMSLTHSFDLSQVTGDAYLDYWTWFDLEKDYDYVYLEVSQDGQNWKTLKTPSGTGDNPSGANYGWGYNNVSKQWIEEKVNLNDYKGENIQIRFEYITDEAVNGEGFLLDDISLPALNYQTDFEKDNGGWDARGFVRVQNILPQTYIISLIEEGTAKTSVERINLDGEEAAKIPLDLEDEYQQATLVVSGAARFTRSEAPFTITIAP